MSQVKKSLGWQLSLKHYGWGLVTIFLLAIVLRFYQLGQVPQGMTWDEAAIGYNGFAVFNTRRDEWLTRFPISFWSFGDYKAPLAIYINGIFTFLFGMNLWAVRLPFAMAGVMAVVGMIYLTRVLLTREGESLGRSRFFALVAGLLITFSPWHHHFSRAGFESGMALMWYIWGLYFFFRSFEVAAMRKHLDSILSAMILVASIYTYHSAKLVVPLTVIFLFVYYRKAVLKSLHQFLIAGAIGAVGLIPLVYDSFWGRGLERAGTLIVSQGYSLLETCRLFLIQLGTHLSPNFLFWGATTTLRHGDGRWGILLPTTFVLLVLGLGYFFRKSSNRQIWGLATALLLIGLFPAALGDEVPHSNRALLALPGFLLLVIFGLKNLLIGLDSTVKRVVLGTALLIHSLFFISYLADYYTDFAQASAADWQDGYLAAFAFALPYERGEGERRAVEKIIFTSDYGQPYIYALFARKTNPIDYHGGSLIKYEFKDEVTIGDLERENVLVVASDTDELLGENSNADHYIYGSDGQVRFRIYIRQ